jgi:hypothetical protein
MESEQAMTTDQLRVLAEALRICADRSHYKTEQTVLDQAAAYLRACADAVPVAWKNVKYGTFFGAGVIAATDRNDDLIASGELIRLFTHPMPQEKP